MIDHDLNLLYKNLKAPRFAEIALEGTKVFFVSGWSQVQFFWGIRDRSRFQASTNALFSGEKNLMQLVIDHGVLHIKYICQILNDVFKCFIFETMVPRRNEGTRQIRVILYASGRGCADLADHERSA